MRIGLLISLIAAVAPSTATTAREPMRAAAAETLSWVRSQESGHELLKPQAPLPFTQPKGPPSLPTLTVNVSKLLQPIIGFGGALTESSASVFAKLTPSAQAAFMEAYFGVSGNRYSLARTHIASCDFALSFYSYHEEPGDFEMKSFNMSRDFELLIPFIQRAKAAVEDPKSGALPFRLVSSPWSPPKWLKTCGELICPVLACGLRVEAPNTPYRTAYATYLSKYLDTMAQAGLKPFAITPQNEPNSCKPAMESMRFERDEEAAFIAQQLGPMLRANHPDVKLLAYDHNKDELSRWADAILGDAKHPWPNLREEQSANYTDGMAFHWYAKKDDFDHVQAVYDAYPGKMLLATEATEVLDTAHFLANQSWAKGEHYGHVILGDLNHGAQGWIDWNVLLDREGGPTHPGRLPDECEGLIKCGDDAMVIADTAYSESAPIDGWYPQIFYYYMGHFSRYLLPGSVRVGLTNPLDRTGHGGDPVGKADGSLEAFAALSPNRTQVVVVVMNRNDSPIQFVLDDAATGRTSGALTLNAHAIHTYWYSVA